LRLDRFLFHHTPLGRREIRCALAAGRVHVEGVVEKDTQRAISDFAQVHIDGELVRENIARYIMLNKPAGYLSATEDPVHRTVMELIDIPQTLHIAGRLDRASTGLLILTNDGKWSRLLTEPKENVPKVYLVETEKTITAETSTKFAEGIYFAYEDLTTASADIEILTNTQARLTIYEGRYHQVKRMFHAVGNRVISLHRESMGDIILDSSLQAGEYRELTAAEINSI